MIFFFVRIQETFPKFLLIFFSIKKTVKNYFMVVAMNKKYYHISHIPMTCIPDDNFQLTDTTAPTVIFTRRDRGPFQKRPVTRFLSGFSSPSSKAAVNPGLPPPRLAGKWRMSLPPRRLHSNLYGNLSEAILLNKKTKGFRSSRGVFSARRVF